MKNTFRLVAVALTLASSSRADEPADKSKLAVDFARAVLTPEAWSNQIALITQQVRAMPGEMKPEERDKMLAEIKKNLPTYEEMIDFEAGLLVKYYTSDELAGLTKFYRSPLGKKSLKIMPEVTADVMGWTQHRMAGMFDRKKAADSK